MNADGELIILEDPTDSSANLFKADHRDASVWMMITSDASWSRIGEMDQSAAPASMRKPYEWETSRVIDASAFFGKRAWLLVVQAHSILDPNTGALQGLPAAAKLSEGGQLPLMRTK